ncbi:MAG: hypothetical protein NXI10_13660 [bacterium]|nr:hypothetical protein [bacterium]
MKKITLTFVLLFSLFAMACNDTSGSKDENGEKKTEETSNKISVSDNPCDLINADDMRTLLNVGAEFEISIEAKDYTFPACSFRWEDGKVIKSMEVGGRSMSVDMPSEVMVVLVKEANEAKFERSTSVYKDGVSVDGLADEAMWGEAMSQLSFRKGSIMMHVNVKVDNDSAVNKDNAMKIAEFLIEKL